MKKNRNRLKLLLLSGLTFFMLTACGKAGTISELKANSVENNDNTVALRFAYASNSQPVIDAMNKFGELVAKKTNGEVTVDYFPDGQLGGERELIELTQTGAIDITKVSGSALEGFSKDYSIFSVPYLFDSEEHFFRVMEDKEIIDPIYQATEDLGFVGITYYDSGQRSFYMADGPIATPDDLKGKKVRVMQSETAIKMVELLGGSPTPMGSDEVFTSMQSNLINGAENNEFVLVTAGHGDVAQYYSYDEHTRVPDIVIMNKETLDKLTDEQEQAIYEAAEESKEFEKKVFKEAVEAEKAAAIEKYDVKFNEVDKAPFREAVKPLHEEFENNEDYAALFKAIRSQGDGLE